MRQRRAIDNAIWDRSQSAPGHCQTLGSAPSRTSLLTRAAETPERLLDRIRCPASRVLVELVLCHSSPPAQLSPSVTTAARHVVPMSNLHGKLDHIPKCGIPSLHRTSVGGLWSEYPSHNAAQDQRWRLQKSYAGGSDTQSVRRMAEMNIRPASGASVPARMSSQYTARAGAPFTMASRPGVDLPVLRWTQLVRSSLKCAWHASDRFSTIGSPTAMCPTRIEGFRTLHMPLSIYRWYVQSIGLSKRLWMRRGGGGGRPQAGLERAASRIWIGCVSRDFE